MGQGVTAGVAVPGDEREPAPVLDLPGCRPNLHFSQGPSPTSCYSSGTWAGAFPGKQHPPVAQRRTRRRRRAAQATGPQAPWGTAGAVAEPSSGVVLLSSPQGAGGYMGSGGGGGCGPCFWGSSFPAKGCHHLWVCRQTEHQSISGLCHESREKSAPSQEPCEGCGWRRAGDGRERFRLCAAQAPGFVGVWATVPASPIQGPAVPAVASRGRTSPALPGMCPNRLTSFSGPSLAWQWPPGDRASSRLPP